MYFIYILKCRDGTLYTGITTDIQRRLLEHKSGHGGAYTKSHGAQKMVYSEEVLDRGTALRREIAIKRLTRQQKIELIK